MQPGVQIGVTAASLGDDPRGWAENAATLGIVGVLLDLVSPRLALTDLSQSGRREFRHQFETRQRSIVGVQLSLGPTDLIRGDADHAIKRIVDATTVAAGLSSPLVCVELGSLPAVVLATKPTPPVTSAMAGLILLPDPIPATAPPVLPTAAAHPAEIARVDGVMAELAGRADRAGVMLAFRSDLASLASLERAVLTSRCPWFGIDLDPTAIVRDAWDADETFSHLGSHVRHVRGKDAIRGEAHRTRPASVGAGSVDWQKLGDNLAGSDYQGWLTIDPVDLPNRLSAVRAAVEHLQRGQR